MANNRLLALGFRPFYLLAAGFAIIAVVHWLFSYRGLLLFGGYLHGTFLHSHAMVFGFAVAVVSGFLLTAVRNWTGLSTPTGLALAGLAIAWLAGRVFIISIVTQAAWVHALAIGAISSMMLAMMVRSSLGHTGRALQASGPDMAAFLLLQLAAILRVLADMAPVDRYFSIVVASGMLWVLAFGVFLYRYVPVLVGPRIDGRPG